MSPVNGALVGCALIGVVVFGYCRYYGEPAYTWAETVKLSAGTTAVLVGCVLVVWFTVAVPISTTKRNNCERLADGYQLDYDWSIRNNCRIKLSTGQLVPADQIRITSDGKIVGE